MMAFFATRTDLALDRDASGRFLPWVIAVMVFMAMLALAGAMVLQRATAGWQRGIEGHLTVQIADQAGQPMAPRLAAAVKELQLVPGVVRAVPLDRAAVELLLAPWLGRENLTSDLPLPGLIDVEVAPGGIDVAAIGARLARTVPGAVVDDPKPWLDRVLRLADLLQILAGAVVLGIGLATVFMVIFATRAGLSSHREAIEVLHLIGARDGYIAGQFQRQTLRLALAGALPAGIAAAGSLIVLGVLAAGAGRGLLPTIGFGPLAWLALAALPVIAIVIATLSARFTVLGYLREML